MVTAGEALEQRHDVAIMDMAAIAAGEAEGNSAPLQSAEAIENGGEKRQARLQSAVDIDISTLGRLHGLQPLNLAES